jgi:hypothetical protein
MKPVIALILSAVAVVTGAIMHYLATAGAGSRGLANAGTELLVAGVIGLASSNVVNLMTRNRRRPAPRNTVSERAQHRPVHTSGR